MLLYVNEVATSDTATFEAVVLLYLSSSRLPDDELGDAEARRILSLTRRHTEGLAPGYAEQVLRDVSARLAAAREPAGRLGLVVGAAEHLRDHLSPEAAAALVDELRSIIRADGQITQSERDFVAAAARTLGVES